MSAESNSVLIIGGGPAGLRAAEVANAAGARVVVCDAQRSVGRKFLIAGRGGLNLTHGEPVENFPARYVDEPDRWRDLLDEFDPDHLRAWAAELGSKPTLAPAGASFREAKKPPAFCARGSGACVQAASNSMSVRVSSLSSATSTAGVLTSRPGDENFSLTAEAIVLALGGASWPETGSDGTWPAILAAHGVEIAPWVPANCGWNVDWPTDLLSRAEGLPLKNLTVRAGDESVSGELLITRHGLEGGAIYRLGRTLRAMTEPCLTIDFKPQLTTEAMRERTANLSAAPDWFRAWKLSPAAVALLETFCVERRQRSRESDRAGEEFQAPAAKSASDRGGNFICGRRALERTR